MTETNYKNARLEKKMPSNRRKKQRECPNPLFLKWLEQWRDEAKQKNSKLQYTYGKVRANSEMPCSNW